MSVRNCLSVITFFARFSIFLSLPTTADEYFEHHYYSVLVVFAGFALAVSKVFLS
jgi:hypothetical protein